MKDKIGNLKLNISKNKEDAAKLASEQINKALDDFNNKNILFLVSGGSAFDILKGVSLDSLNEKMTIAVLDERYDKTNKNNNFSQLKKTDFYKNALSKSCEFIDTSVKEDQTEEELADFFNDKLKDWRNKNPQGKILATLGVGKDGHTSGIMPFVGDESGFNELFEGDRFVVFYDASGKNEHTKRVTTSNTFLRLIDEVVVYLVGSEKKEAFKHLQENVKVSDMPAKIILDLKGTVYVDNNVAK